MLLFGKSSSRNRSKYTRCQHNVEKEANVYIYIYIYQSTNILDKKLIYIDTYHKYTKYNALQHPIDMGFPYDTSFPALLTANWNINHLKADIG
jgi:hypothetical protein